MNWPIREVVHNEGVLEHLILDDHSRHSLKALFAKLLIEQKESFVKTASCASLDSGHIEVDMFGKMTVQGIYAVGDCAHPMRAIATAVYTGNIAGAMINKDLIEEDF